MGLMKRLLMSVPQLQRSAIMLAMCMWPRWKSCAWWPPQPQSSPFSDSAKNIILTFP